jgi:hypothetical protein
VSATGGSGANAMPASLAHSRATRAAPPLGTASRETPRIRHRRPARAEGSRRRSFAHSTGLFPGETASIPTPCRHLANSREYQPLSHMRRAGIRFALLTDNNDHARGQGDSHGDLLRSYPSSRHQCQRPRAVDWRCVVDGPHFQGTAVRGRRFHGSPPRTTGELRKPFPLFPVS